MIPRKKPPTTGSCRIDYPADKLLPVLNQKVVVDAAKKTGNTSLVAVIVPCGTFDITMLHRCPTGVLTYSKGSDVAVAAACISFLDVTAQAQENPQHFAVAAAALREFVAMRMKETRGS